MSETLVYIVRHCQGQGNVDGTLRGRYDHEITETGWKQLEVLSHLTAPIPFEQVYTSPLKRANETGKAANRTAKAPLEIYEPLIEVDFGELDGQIWNELPGRYPELMKAWDERADLVEFPGGETMLGAMKRITAAFWHCVSASRGKVILLAGHGSAFRTLHCVLNGWPPEMLSQTPRMVNTGLSCFRVTEDDRVIPVFQMKEDHIQPERAAELLADAPDEEIQASLAYLPR